MIQCIMGQLYFVFAEGEPCLVKCMRGDARLQLWFYFLNYNTVCDLVNFLKIDMIMLMPPKTKLGQMC